MQMRRKKITMSRLASQINISVSAISQFFGDKATISQSNIDKMIKIIEQA